MREKLIAALYALQPQNWNPSRRDQLQKQVDDHLQQIEEYKNRLSSAQIYMKRPRRKIILGIFSPILSVFSLICLLGLGLDKIAPEAVEIGSDLFPFFLINYIAFFLCLGPILPIIIRSTINKNILNNDPKKLQNLEEGDLYRQRLGWLKEIEILDSQKWEHLSLTEDALAFLPESCRSVQAVTFMISCLDSGFVDSIPAAVRAWELTQENQSLQSQLESIQLQNSAKKEHLLKSLRDEISSSMDGFSILDALLH